jgi:putative endonuclease
VERSAVARLAAKTTIRPMRKEEHHYYVYIVASRTRVLYVGITNGIRRRSQEHRAGETEGFTATYNCDRLVWFEHYQYARNAIDREKQIKRWFARKEDRSD